MFSSAYYEKAKTLIPGGVNSPVRAFNGVGGEPVFFDHGKGAYVYDVDGKKYIDYVASWGPLIHGHADDDVIEAVMAQAKKGLTFGAPTAIEVEMAELICELIPSIEMVRMVNSGTEATMTAIRLARGFTKRDKFIKFAGCYHGHADSLLVKAGSGLLTLGIPSCPGVPADLVQHTLVAEFNHLSQVEDLFQAHGADIAAIILEPVACNMNCVLPSQEFLVGLRKLCDQYGSLLIFDEVITGFRLGLSGAQGYYNIKPDLTTLGKIIGGGMPVGAYGGRRDVMEHMAPVGTVYQAGTLSGNPVAMAAGLVNLKKLQQPGFYEHLAEKNRLFTQGLSVTAKKYDIPLFIQSIESIFGLFFTNQTQINTFNDVARCDIRLFQLFFHAMLEKGVYLAPSAFEAGFISASHSIADIQETIQIADTVFAKLALL